MLTHTSSTLCMTGLMQLLNACMLAIHMALLPDVSAMLRIILDKMPCGVLYVYSL